MEVAVYKGDDLLCAGTIPECAEKLEVQPATVRFYMTPCYRRRLKSRKNGNYHNQRMVVKV